MAPVHSISHMNKSNKLSIIITLLYVGVGTISVCGIYPADPFYFEWSLLPFTLLLTLPVNFISFLYRFAENSYDLSFVIFIQSVMLIPTFIVVRRILKRKR